MKADEVLKLRGRGKKDAAAEPQWVAQGVAEWRYKDCSVLMVYSDGCYRVGRVTQR
jgi:hypothetical protein